MVSTHLGVVSFRYVVIFVLYCAFWYAWCLESYWGEATSLRGYVLDIGMLSVLIPNYRECMLYCMATEGCGLVSYTNTTSNCTLHERWAPYQFDEASSSVWYSINDEDCPWEMVRFETSCYLFYYYKMTWTESLAFCEKLNGRLTEVDSEAKRNFLKTTTISIDKHRWLAASDIVTEGKWRWEISGNIVENHTDWQDGNPDNEGSLGPDADCLVMGSWVNYGWDDVECFNLHRPICEIQGM